jgi:hypothetical protein
MKYFSFSSYTNAWSLKKGLKKLGMNLHVISEEYSFVKPDNTLIPQKGDVLFFTEESSLLVYAGQEEIFQFYPRQAGLEQIRDKVSFAQFLRMLGEKAVPDYALEDVHTFPLVLKARYSWQDGKKLPRAELCFSSEDVNRRLREYAARGLERDDFFLQKFLGGDTRNNISVSGFFDHTDDANNALIITSRIPVHGKPDFSTGILVRTMSDPANLTERTKKILSALNYTGPFELEFFAGPEDGSYYVLELNPRFWLQHHIFVRYMDNAVIKKYLGMPVASTQLKSEPILWVDTSALLRFFPRRAFFAAVGIIIRHYLAGGHGCLAPSLGTYFRYYFRIKSRPRR